MNYTTVQFPEEMTEGSIPSSILSRESLNALNTYINDFHFNRIFETQEVEIKRILQLNGYSEYDCPMFRIAEITNMRLHNGGYIDITFILNVKGDLFEDKIILSDTRVSESRYQYTSYKYSRFFNEKGLTLKLCLQKDVDLYIETQSKSRLSKLLSKLKSPLVSIKRKIKVKR